VVTMKSSTFYDIMLMYSGERQPTFQRNITLTSEDGALFAHI
jgi:hypothetical protein